MNLLPGVVVSGNDIAGENENVLALDDTKSVELFPFQPAKYVRFTFYTLI